MGAGRAPRWRPGTLPATAIVARETRAPPRLTVGSRWAEQPYDGSDVHSGFDEALPQKTIQAFAPSSPYLSSHGPKFGSV